jgi:hypothetical protein
MNPHWADDHHMDLEGYIARVNHHLEQMGIDSRPSLDQCVEAWNSQMPARKMAETYRRRLHKSHPKPE